MPSYRLICAKCFLDKKNWSLKRAKKTYFFAGGNRRDVENFFTKKRLGFSVFSRDILKSIFFSERKEKRRKRREQKKIGKAKNKIFSKCRWRGREVFLEFSFQTQKKKINKSFVYKFKLNRVSFVVSSISLFKKTPLFLRFRYKNSSGWKQKKKKKNLLNKREYKLLI